MVNFSEEQSFRYCMGTETTASPVSLLLESALVREFVVGEHHVFEPTREFRDWAREYDTASRTHQALPALPPSFAQCLIKGFQLKNRFSHQQTVVHCGETRRVRLRVPASEGSEAKASAYAPCRSKARRLKSSSTARREWGMAAAAEGFISLNPPPEHDGISCHFQKFACQTKKRRKEWRIPFVSVRSGALLADFTLVGRQPHWRFRFAGRQGKTGRASREEKMALSIFVMSAGGDATRLATPRKWAPAPTTVLAGMNPFVRAFLAAINRL